MHFSGNGEKHISDIKTSSGLVVELQNSPISLSELRSREEFYDNMIWIVNAKRFQSNFHILTMLPPPNSDLAADLHIVRAPRYPIDPSINGFSSNNLPIIVRKKHVKTLIGGAVAINLGGISAGEFPKGKCNNVLATFEKIREVESPFRFLDWRRPHAAWVDARKPVYFDLGDGKLWRLDRFHEIFRCVEQIDTAKFVTNLLTDMRTTADDV